MAYCIIYSRDGAEKRTFAENLDEVVRFIEIIKIVDGMELISVNAK
jgi:hypothetical protein